MNILRHKYLSIYNIELKTAVKIKYQCIPRRKIYFIKRNKKNN